MRTTLEIDDDILVAVKEIAAGRGTSVGRVLSDLARRALEPEGRVERRGGILLLPRRAAGAEKPTLEKVNRLRDEA